MNPNPIQAREAQPPRFGLLRTLGLAAGTATSEGERWDTSGIAVLPESCPLTGREDPKCGNDVDRDAQTRRPSSVIEAEPFTVYATEECSTFPTVESWRGRVERALRACQSQEIEAELWGVNAVLTGTGDHGDAQHLNDGSTPVLGDGLEPAEGLALLEGYAGDRGCGQVAMIHATPNVVTLWQKDGLLRREGDVLYTVLDTIVVPGTGYDGSGPGGVPGADGAVFAYVTSRVEVRLGPVQVLGDEPEQIGRSTNLRKVWAQREAAYWWEGCVAGAVSLDVLAVPNFESGS